MMKKKQKRKENDEQKKSETKSFILSSVVRNLFHFPFGGNFLFFIFKTAKTRLDEETTTTKKTESFRFDNFPSDSGRGGGGRL